MLPHFAGPAPSDAGYADLLRLTSRAHSSGGGSDTGSASADNWFGPAPQTAALVSPRRPQSAASQTSTSSNSRGPRLATYRVLTPDGTRRTGSPSPAAAVSDGDAFTEPTARGIEQPPPSRSRDWRLPVDRIRGNSSSDSGSTRRLAVSPTASPEPHASIGSELKGRMQRQLAATILAAVQEGADAIPSSRPRSSRSATREVMEAAIAKAAGSSSVAAGGAALAAAMVADRPVSRRSADSRLGERPPTAPPQAAVAPPAPELPPPTAAAPALPSTATGGRARALVQELLTAASTPGKAVPAGYVDAIVRSTRLADLSVFDRPDVFGGEPGGGLATGLRDTVAGVAGRGTTVADLRLERVRVGGGSGGGSREATPVPGARSSRADERRLAVVSPPAGPGPRGVPSRRPAAAGGCGGSATSDAGLGLMSRYDTYAAFPGLYGRVDARAAALKLRAPPGGVAVIPQAVTRGLRPPAAAMMGGVDSCGGGLPVAAAAAPSDAPPPTYSVHSLARLKPALISAVLGFLGEPRRVLL